MRIVPQRTNADCAVAAFATVMGWNYQRARDALGRCATAGGTCLQPLALPLLRAGIGATYLMVRDHPCFLAEHAVHSDIRFFPSEDEVRQQLAGRRAILAVDGSGFGVQFTEGQGHAIAWDGVEAVECGGPNRPARTIDLGEQRILEALILTEAPAAIRPEPTVPPEAADASSLAEIVDRHATIILSFSGGKESIVLAKLLEPWRDRITLAWVNTGAMAPHMVEFVRRYRDRGWTLEELRSPDLREHGQTHGLPADVFPQANIAGEAEPRLQPWAYCCRIIRQEPLNAYLRGLSGPVAFVTAQRQADIGGATVAGLSSQLPRTVEVVQPLAGWSDADVWTYIAEHDLELPEQYAAGFPSSIECLSCPADLSTGRLAYLARRYPDAVPAVIGAVQHTTAIGIEALMRIATVTAPYIPHAQELA